MCWEREFVLPDDRVAPLYARHLCDQELSAVMTGEGQELRQDAAVIVSELVTNAIQAGARSPVLGLVMHRTNLEIMVTDDAPGYPHRQDAPPSATRGRGLQIVAALAAQWGMTEEAGHSKRVWAHLRIDPSLTTGLRCELAT